MICVIHEWRSEGERSFCIVCGVEVDRPHQPPRKPRHIAKAWQRQRQVMLERLRKPNRSP